MMKVENIEFLSFESKMKKQMDDGIVLLGCGGDPQEWIQGVTQVLRKEEIIDSEVTSEKAWKEAFLLTTTGGRHDIALTFNSNTAFNISKMAMWRLQFGDCSWISDYTVNYVDQHLA
jgi:hypothetical protein